MATQSILVEDCSPLIQYAPPGAWQDSQANDTLAASYSGGSYHVTSTQGATATFQFRGIGFTVTGARRPGYGPFSILLDGQQRYIGNPTPAPDSDIKNNLASISGLTNDIHTVVLTNTGGAPVDIDSITFQVQIGDATVAPNVTTIDDNNPRITYLPTDAWEQNPNAAFYDGGLHYSSAPNATASLQFTGSVIGFYGTVSPDHADVSITIDDKIMTMPIGSASRVVTLRPQVLMYWADDLGEGQHTMTITKVQNTNMGPFVDVDSFVVFSSATADNTTAPSASPKAASKQAMNRTDVIVIASVAGVVSILLFIVGFFLFLKYRLQRRRLGNIKSVISPTTPILPMQGVMESSSDRRPSPGYKGGNSAFRSPLPAPLSPLRRKKSQQLSRLSVAPSYYGDPDFSSGNEMPGGRNASDGFTPAVPRLAVPRAPESLQTVPVAVVTDAMLSPHRSSRPSRPRRPPTLDIGSLDSLR